MTDRESSRRSFLKAGALLATPLAGVGLPAVALAKEGTDRLADEAAIRRLHRDWLRRINRGDAAFGNVRAIAADHAAEPDKIAIAADGRRASGRFPCTVEAVTELALDTTFAQMAHLQGGGIARTSERRVLAVDYVKSAGSWAIADMRFA